ncbi:MAG TPA: DUF4331 family protein [Acidobacteriaceae bacterium]|jgi:hypothetical protein|nr:DUF4331 family protein [Acidobacteriaceae bacterium]
MSHHFDTVLAKEDPSLNLCDFYLFNGAPGTTVMAMTVNPDLGLSAPDTLHIEGLYAFRFDLDGDAREEVTFKLRFSEPHHADHDEHRHIQPFQVFRATGTDALRGAAGELLIEGETGAAVSNANARAYVGIAPDLFAGDAFALHTFLVAFYKESRFDAASFQHRQNFFARRNLTAIVLEIPNHLIGEGLIHAWATISLSGHAPEIQVSRWGLPLVTHLFLNDPADQQVKEQFNTSVPSEDVAHFSKSIADFTEKMTAYAGSAADPSAYAHQVADKLCPDTLPYEPGTPAAFRVASFNGRALIDDAMDVMLSIASNTALSDGVAPNTARIRTEFPYFGEPYTKDEQAGVTPVSRPAKK